MSKRDDEQVSYLARRPWLLVTGGMIIIGIVNVGLGVWLFADPTPEEETEIPSFMPPREDAGADDVMPDAGPEPAAPPAP